MLKSAGAELRSREAESTHSCADQLWGLAHKPSEAIAPVCGVGIWRFARGHDVFTLSDRHIVEDQLGTHRSRNEPTAGPEGDVQSRIRDKAQDKVDEG